MGKRRCYHRHVQRNYRAAVDDMHLVQYVVCAYPSPQGRLCVRERCSVRTFPDCYCTERHYIPKKLTLVSACDHEGSL